MLVDEVDTSADSPAALAGLAVGDRISKVDGRTVRLAGIAKGAAMIGPNMATMLCFVVTDAALNAATLQDILRAAVEESNFAGWG